MHNLISLEKQFVPNVSGLVMLSTWFLIIHFVFNHHYAQKLRGFVKSILSLMSTLHVLSLLLSYTFCLCTIGLLLMDGNVYSSCKLLTSFYVRICATTPNMHLPRYHGYEVAQYFKLTTRRQVHKVVCFSWKYMIQRMI